MDTHTFKKLLIAVMDSPSSRHAGGQGIALAASLGASVVGVSVLPAYEGGMSLLHLTDMRAQVEAPHRKALNELGQLAKKTDTPYRSALLEGQPFEAIADMAEAEDADLIILGGAPRTALERSILGATSARIIGYARRPVLVIPEGAQVDFGRIVLGTDGSRCGESARNLGLRLAKAYGAELRAVAVIDAPAEYRIYEKAMQIFSERARNALALVKMQGEELGLNVSTEVIQGDTADAIVEKAEAIGAGLIVLGTHGRTGLKRLMLGSVAAGVIRQSRAATLVVP